MESRSISEYIFIGTAIRFLQDTQHGPHLRGPTGIVQNYEALLSWLENNRLRVSYRIAEEELSHLIDKVREIDSDEDPDDDDDDDDDDDSSDHITLPGDLARQIREGALRLRRTVDAEAVDFSAYVVSPKRYSSEALLDDPGILMAPKVFDSLTPLAQYDFAEGCRAIAFELPTAAAFHLLRGTEEVLRNFYCSIVKQKRVSPLLWGPMITGLRNRKTNPPPGVLLNNLDNLRLNFRNPTQHPDKVYDIHEVQDLLNLCIDVINRMVKYMTT
jgi:hypothetical protein